MRKLFLLLLLPIGTLACGVGAPELASLEAGEFINTDENGVALYGYDVVAYFSEESPVKGSADITYLWRSAEWHFASEENRDLFAQDPEKYAPQYGGYCASGVLAERAAEVDPEAFAIVDGKLYLNNNEKAHTKWLKKTDEHIPEANAIWSSAATF